MAEAIRDKIKKKMGPFFFIVFPVFKVKGGVKLASWVVIVGIAWFFIESSGGHEGCILEVPLW